MRTVNENMYDILESRPYTEVWTDSGRKIFGADYEGTTFYLGISQAASFDEDYDASEIESRIDMPDHAGPVTLEELGEDAIGRGFVRDVWSEICRETGAWVGMTADDLEEFMDLGIPGPYDVYFDQLASSREAETVEVDGETVYMPTQSFAKKVLGLEKIRK